MRTRARNNIAIRFWLGTAPRRGGFTLIEVLLAAFVLALGVLGLAALFAGGARQQQLATETTRASSLADAALAWQGSFGVMSSLDEDGNGLPDFDEVIDVGRWYALATIDSNDINDGRVSLVARDAGGNLVRYDAQEGNFQPHFRKVNDTPVVLYQRPPHWSPRLNDAVPADGPIHEVSQSAAQSAGSYDPQTPGSMFAVRPYSLFTPSPTTPEDERIAGPAFLPDRAILPESVELTVTYFEYDERYVFGQTPTLASVDPFNMPDGTGQTPPGVNEAAIPAGRVINEPQVSDFRWVDHRSPIFTGTPAIVPLADRVPANILPGAVLDPSPPLSVENPPEFPDEPIWNPNGDTDLYYYGVFMPAGGRYPLEFDVNDLPIDTAVAPRPSYLVMHLAPDLETNDLEDPNPTIVAFELGGVLADRFRIPDQFGNQFDAGPLRSVEQIRVERYASRLERMPAPRDRVVTVPDETRPEGTRPVLGYSTLYRRTPDGQGEIAIFGYRISPVTASSGPFEPFEDPARYAGNGRSPIVNSTFRVNWDPVRQQYFVVFGGVPADADAVIRPGALILFGGPLGVSGSGEDAFGADDAVRITTRVRRDGQLRGYLDRPPTFRGRPLGNLADTPPTEQGLTGWHVRDRVQSNDPDAGNALFQLESLEVRIIPMRER